MMAHTEQIRKLILASIRLDGAYYYFARRFGAKENLLFLLYALDDGAPHSQTEICRDWLIPKTTVNTNMKELVSGGYATLRQGGTREKTIALTDSGRAYAERLLGQLHAAEQAAMEQTLASFSSDFVDAMDCFAQRLCGEFKARAAGDKTKGNGEETI